MADGRAPRRQTTFGGLPQLGIRPRAPPRALASPAPSHGLATAGTDIYEPALHVRNQEWRRRPLGPCGRRRRDDLYSLGPVIGPAKRGREIIRHEYVQPE